MTNRCPDCGLESGSNHAHCTRCNIEHRYAQPATAECAGCGDTLDPFELDVTGRCVYCRKEDSADLQSIVSLRLQGLSMDAIADHLNTSRAVINRYLSSLDHIQEAAR